MNKRIGIMGGTFNPIHYGHLLLAETAYHEFSLDEVMIMPNKSPVYKKVHSLIKDEDRLAMIKLAIEGNVHFRLSTIEFEREGHTYTIDTINKLTSTFPENEYYFIMGADSLFQFESWKKPEEILEKVNILVAGRSEKSYNEIDSQIDYLQSVYGCGHIEYLHSPNLEISSHNIRKRISNKQSIKYLVPEAVEKYIIENNLYGDGSYVRWTIN